MASSAAALKVTWFTVAWPRKVKVGHGGHCFPHAVLSMMTAIPWPPPMQADPTAYFPPRRLEKKAVAEIYSHS